MLASGFSVSVFWVASSLPSSSSASASSGLNVTLPTETLGIWFTISRQRKR